jgi:hypothetical protein
MLSTAIRRQFSASNHANLNKTVAILANSKQADLIGQRIMHDLKVVSGVDDFNFFGYGGQAMTREGMSGQIEVDLNEFQGPKDFTTFRKTKNYNEMQYSTKYKFVNFVNKHFVRNSDSILANFDRVEVSKRIYHARPSVVLSLDNEYITFRLFDQLKGKQICLNLLLNRLLPALCQRHATSPLPQPLYQGLQAMGRSLH